MGNRAVRRAMERSTGRVTPSRPKPAIGQGPTMSVFSEQGAVVVHVGFGDVWVNQVRMSVTDAENHVRELQDVIRGLRTGLVVSNKPSGLIVPGVGDANLR